MHSSSVRGTARYIVGTVERFDQKNEMFKRVTWDPQFDGARERFSDKKSSKVKKGFSHQDGAFADAAWYIEHEFACGNAIHNSGMYSWESKMQRGHGRTPPGLKMEVKDPAKMSEDIKKVARHFGASQAGICELDRRWIYSHSFNLRTQEHKEFEVPEECKYAIVLVFEMDYGLVKASPAWTMSGAEGLGYSKMPFVSSMLAQFIRGLGYRALPCGNDTALSVPLAIDAGLGELARNGILITKEFGPRVRIAKVLTDLPLAPYEPIEFGVTEFCEKCMRCAQYCPGQAISQGERTSEPLNISNSGGVLKWPVNAEDCVSFWLRNNGSCMNCILVCPFNKPAGWTHNLVRWFVKHTPWFDTFLVRMDTLFGYGKQANTDSYWAK